MQFQQRLQTTNICQRDCVFICVVQSHILYVFICYLFDQDISYWICISIHTHVSKLLLLLNGPSSNVLLSWSNSTFAFFYGLYFAGALFPFFVQNPEIPYSPTVSKLWARRMWLRTTCTIGFWYVVLLKYICPRVVTKLKIVSFWTSHTSFIISFLFDCIISCKQWWLRRKPGCLVR